jgi:hypothetical protein
MPNLKRQLALLVALVLAVFSGHAFAGKHEQARGRRSLDSPRRLVFDFDGDHQSDVAVAQRRGSTYKISIRFSGQRERLSFTMPAGSGIGLALVAYDIDRDSHADLVLTSASSLRPIAIWVNQGKGRFKKSHRTFATVLARQAGPQLRHKITSRFQQAILTSDDDPLSDLGNFHLLAVDVLGKRIQPRFERLSLSNDPCGFADPRGPPLPHVL